LGAEVTNEYLLEINEKKICFHHGHRYDSFINEHPYQTLVADWIYWLIQKLDPSHVWAQSAKHASKTFLRNSEIIEEKSLEYAAKKGYDTIICGHTHHAIAHPGKISYYNSGSWAELPCTFLTINNGQVELHYYRA